MKKWASYVQIRGRSVSTERILNSTAAYSSRRYQGNLCDIFNVVVPKRACIKSTVPGALSSTIGRPPKYYIDNHVLEGFLELFKDRNCLLGCSDCGYCEKIPREVIRVDRD